MQKIHAIALAALAIGCSTRRDEPVKTQAPPIAATALGSRARAALDGLRLHASLENRLGRGVTLARDERGFRFERAKTTSSVVAAGGSVLTGFAPLRANGAVHVARGDRPGVSLDVESALADVIGEASEGAVIYPDAAPEQDVVQVLDGVRIEELRVLKSARAATKFTWSLRPGPAVTDVRLRDGRVEVLEGSEVRLISEPVVAFDAKDTGRAATLTLAKVDSYYVLEATLDAHDLAYPVVLDPGWTRTYNKMSAIHRLTKAIPLSGGKVAVFPGPSGTTTVDIFDPVTNTFSAGPPTKVVRWNGGAVKLAGEKVLYVGGDYGSATTYEIWDPVTGSAEAVTMTQSLPAPRVVILGSGKIFAFANGTQKAAIYDPPTSTWTSTTDSIWSHGSGAAVLLKSGKVLVSGGCCSHAYSELYDPTLDTWTATGGMSGARSGHSMSLLPSGKVLVAGRDSGGTVHANLFDPTTNTYAALATPIGIDGGHEAITMADGSIMLVNVNASGDMLRYTEGTGWTTEARLTMRRDNPALAHLPGGRLLAAGGDNGTSGLDNSNNTAEVWGPTPKTCTSATECTSGFCVDGHCCDRACGEQCYACDVAGREGFCSPVDGAPPHGTRTSCSPYLNCSNGACFSGCSTAGDCATGMGCIYGTCAVKLANGAACVSGTDCTSGNCVDGVCCNSACTEQCKACDNSGSLGTCSDVSGAPHGARTSCAPFACGGGACLTTCSSDAQCVAGNRCNSAGACVPTLAAGQACTRSTECTTGFCVDGYCCNTACNTACRTCAKVGSLGTCSLVAAGTSDPRKLCTGECANGCGTTGCTYKANTTPCGQSCIGNQLTSGGRCSGTSEACAGATTLPCAGGLVCADGNTCKTTCVTGADCVSGYCDMGVCGAPPDAGPPEEPTIEAGPDAPADTTIDDTAVADTTVADTTIDDTTPARIDAVAEVPAPPLDPKPVLPVTVQTCTKSSECPSGHCVEGVCCDTECTDRCHSCALLSNPGKCTLEPIGVDLKQECGPAFTCLGTCGAAGECIGAGQGTLCARNRCTGPSTGVGPSYCSAPGAKCSLDEGVPFDCAPYACAPAFGACLQACATSKDCANGFVCDTGSKTCVAPALEEDSGCSTSSTGSRAGTSAFALFIAATLIATRRRRRHP